MPYKNKDDFNKWFRDNWKKRKPQYEARVKKKQAKVRALKASCGCKVCGEKDPICLDYHHTDPKTKLFDICRAVCTGIAWDKIVLEIAKCEVLCANCHRRHHYQG